MAKVIVKMDSKVLDNLVRDECIEFLCWVDGEGYQCDLHTDDNEKIWQAYNSKPYYSTSELYDHFKKSQSKEK